MKSNNLEVPSLKLCCRKLAMSLKAGVLGIDWTVDKIGSGLLLNSISILQAQTIEDTPAYCTIEYCPFCGKPLYKKEEF